MWRWNYIQHLRCRSHYRTKLCSTPLILYSWFPELGIQLRFCLHRQTCLRKLSPSLNYCRRHNGHMVKFDKKSMERVIMFLNPIQYFVEFESFTSCYKSLNRFNWIRSPGAVQVWLLTLQSNQKRRQLHYKDVFAEWALGKQLMRARVWDEDSLWIHNFISG
jgi:hypothetical protein